MSESGKPRRPSTKPRRDRPQPWARDARVDSTPPPPEESVAVHPRLSRPPAEAMPARIATLEAEVERLRQQHAADADEVGAMLVRVADVEREKRTAVERGDELALRLGDLEKQLEAARSGQEQTLETAERRAAMAERSASDAAQALEHTRAELQMDRARLVDLEAKLARLRREHGETLESTRQELAVEADAREAKLRESLQSEHEAKLLELEGKHADAMRREKEENAAALRQLLAEHAAAKRDAAHALEGERSAHARARQQATAAEASLASARSAMERSAEILDEMARRDEMASALRARSLEQARAALTAPAAGPAPTLAPVPAPMLAPTPAPAPAPAPAPPRPPAAAQSLKRPPRPAPPNESRIEVASLDDLDIDLAE